MTDETQAESIEPGALIAGHTFGRYKLQRVLGQGGMGIVWAAHDESLERTVAIKVLRTASASDAMRKRLLREARAMARLKHPNVLTVYEVGTDRERDFIAMELVEGHSLFEWLQHDPKPQEVWTALLAAGRGLAAAHAAGLVHRDFKPHNVLRSSGGRVLVTDFGLARGLGEDSESEVANAVTAELDTKVRPSAKSFRTDSVLDSPLTKTGMLLGTPAYMAPEQFVGAEPDPRTDQFAYCVTAWHMLTGSRPFHGDSVEDLQRAASGGARHLTATLDKSVRAVLERGLEARPDARWPSMDDLLAALEAARAPKPVRGHRLAIPIAACALATGAVAFAVVVRDGRDKKPVANKSDCEDAATALAEAWSPALRKQLEANHSTAPAPVVASVVTSLDGLAKQWTTEYEATCKAGPKQKLFKERIACLVGVRDQMCTFSHVVIEAESPSLARWDSSGQLPDLEACKAPNPVGPPRFPDEQPLRGTVFTALKKTMTLARQTDEELAATAQHLVKQAEATAWPPLRGIVGVALGNELLRRGRVHEARPLLRAAVESAQAARDLRSVAQARIGLLDAALSALESPSMERAKPGELHDEIEALRKSAEVAVETAANDPTLVASLALVEATAYAGVAYGNRHPRAFRRAIERAADARAIYVRLHDLRRASIAAATEAGIRLFGKDDRAIDDALHVVRSAQEALEREKLPVDLGLDDVRAKIAYERGEFAEAHARYDQAGEPAPPEAPVVIEGRVVDTAGQPVANATVVAWVGTLSGDPVRVYTVPREFSGAIVLTGVDGTFTINAPSTAAIVAQSGDRRALPQLAATRPTLRLVPTYAVAGNVEGNAPFWANAYARYSIGGNAWYVQRPLKGDGTFQIGGLPRGGSPQIGTIGFPGVATTHRIAGTPTKLAWPSGQTLDVIVRSPDASYGYVYIFRGKVDATTRVQVETLAVRSEDIAGAMPVLVGASSTEAGRPEYRAGDRHAVFPGMVDGDITACAVVGENARCEPHTIKKPIDFVLVEL